jgi:hypothetical protein
MKNLLLNVLLYAAVLTFVLLAAPPGSLPLALWILALLLSIALILGPLLSFWFEGGLKDNLRRSFRITLRSVAVLFLLTYCILCLSILL